MAHQSAARGMEDLQQVLLLSGGVGILLIVLTLFGIVWYRRKLGYSILSLARLQHLSSQKTAMLPSIVDEEGEEDSSDSSDECDAFKNVGKSGCMTPSSSSIALDSNINHNGALLASLPSDLWLDIVIATGPLHHARAVLGLRTSCRALRRALDGASFWQTLLFHAFGAWSPWMGALGWVQASLPVGGASSSTTSASAAASTAASSAPSASSSTHTSGGSVPVTHATAAVVDKVPQQGSSSTPRTATSTSFACCASSSSCSSSSPSVTLASAAGAPGAPSASGGASATASSSAARRGSSIVERRAWHTRYVSCCRDQALLRQAARQLLAAALPIEQLVVLGPRAGEERPFGGSVASSGDGGQPAASGASNSVHDARAAGIGEVPVVGSGGGSTAATARNHQHQHQYHRGPHSQASQLPPQQQPAHAPRTTRSSIFGASGGSRRLADDDVDDQIDETDICVAHVCVPTSTLWAPAAVGGHVSFWGFHTAELPSLRAVWGGRGPTPTQVARALMRRQQWRIDALSARVARSCRTQRRLVPVWRRVTVDELPDFAPSAYDASDAETERAAAVAAGMGIGGMDTTGSHAAQGGRRRWRGRLQQMHSMLAGGSAGQPECWVAHLAKGASMTRTLEMRQFASSAWGSAVARTEEDTSCWMLVLTTTRHAIWVDFFNDASSLEEEVDI